MIELDKDVNYLLTKFGNKFVQMNQLTKEETNKKKRLIKRSDMSINCEIPPPRKRKYLFLKRVENVADKNCVADESEEEKEVTNIETDGDGQSCECCCLLSILYVCFFMCSL